MGHPSMRTRYDIHSIRVDQRRPFFWYASGAALPRRADEPSAMLFLTRLLLASMIAAMLLAAAAGR